MSDTAERPGTAPESGSRPGTGLVATPLKPGEELSLDRQLYNAALNNKLFLVNSLLALGGRPDGHRSQHGNTALMVASMSNDTGPVVSALLRAGASTELSNNFGDTALGLARSIANKSADTIRRIEAGDGIEKGAVMRVGLRTPAVGSAREAVRFGAATGGGSVGGGGSGSANQSGGAALLDTLEARDASGGGGGGLSSAAAAADISALQQQLAQRDAAIAARDKTIEQRDATIEKRDATIAALHDKMAS